MSGRWTVQDESFSLQLATFRAVLCLPRSRDEILQACDERTQVSHHARRFGSDGLPIPVDQGGRTSSQPVTANAGGHACGWTWAGLSSSWSPVALSLGRIGALVESSSTRFASRRTIVIAIGGVAILALCSPRESFYGVIYNASGSVPIGWYVADGRAVPRRGMLMLVAFPEPWRQWAARRHYLPPNVMALKYLSAGPGDKVCARGDRVLLNGRLAALRFRHDGSGRPMPRWSGCITLGKRHWFLLNPASSSFDSRYIGPVLGTALQAKAIPL